MNRNSSSSIPILGFQDAQAHPFSNGNTGLVLTIMLRGFLFPSDTAFNSLFDAMDMHVSIPICVCTL